MLPTFYSRRAKTFIRCPHGWVVVTPVAGDNFLVGSKLTRWERVDRLSTPDVVRGHVERNGGYISHNLGPLSEAKKHQPDPLPVPQPPAEDVDPEQFIKGFANRDAWPELTKLCQYIREHDLGYSGNVERTGRYVHQNSTDFTLNVDSYRTDLTPEQEDEVNTLADAVQAGIQEEIRDTINERIYRALEREYEYQNSDENVAENIRINHYTFNEDGNRADEGEAEQLFEYDQLENSAQETAREWYRRVSAEHDQWYEYTIDEWKEELERMGFENADIAFSGFWSQGDGASFTCKSFDIFKFAEFFKYGPPTERGQPYTDQLYVKEAVDPDDPEQFIKHEVSRRSEPIKEIKVYGRRWFQRGPGNTYHSAYIYINGKLVHTIPYMYGYGDQYLWDAFAWLERNGYVDKTENEPPWVTAERMGIKLDYSAMDVTRKRDL